MTDFSWDDSLDPNKKQTATAATGAANPLGGYDAMFGGSMPNSAAATPSPTDPNTSAMAGATPAPASGANAAAPQNPAASPTPAAQTPAAPTDVWSASTATKAAPPLMSSQASVDGAPGAGAETPPAGSTAAPASGSSDITSKYKDLMGQIGTAADPQQKEVLKDQLARAVFVSLKTAGHDVKWDGDQLMVDGRAYVVGSGSGIAAGEGSPNAPGSAPTLDQASAPSAAAASGYGGFSFDRLPPGVDATNPVTQQVLTLLKQAGVQPGGRGAGFTDVAYWAEHPDQLARLAADLQGNGPDEPGPDGVGRGSGSSGAPGGTPIDNGGLLDPQAPGAAGTPTGGGPYVPGAAAPAAPPPWAPTAPVYAPGPVDNSDLTGYSQDDLAKRLGTGTTVTNLPTDYQAGTVSNDPLATYSYDGQKDLGTLGAGKTQGSTEDLVSSILANPESMDPRTVEMMKAKSKDELAQMQNQEEDDLTAAGYRTGNADSNWLASEKLASAGRRDQGVVASNRAVDMQAAANNLADRKSAAALGQSFSDSKALNARADAAEKLAQQQADEGDKQAAAASMAQAQEYRRQGEQINEQFRGAAADRNMKATQQNIDNQFQSTAERQTAFKLVADTALAASAQKGDRMAFEEGLKQKATELGQSADKLRQDYVLAALHEATTKYGIDVGADIDRAKLTQAGTEFQQDLLFRLKALEQSHDEFGAQYGLDLTKTQHTIDQDNYNNYASTFG